ncbi:hypothetical protein GN958_ATG06436 [Phytophthora infestans]|uniref:Uncharacterized protein n=1 Tax=Phytophthora infestans TaxID=4787 RepID=A0A8S9UYS7_PHYIN|nr:hypothetical protein GN958_ATG06436 [Phytophthora infestans]
MSSNLARDTAAPPSTSAQSSAADTASTSMTTITTTATTSTNTNSNADSSNTSPSGSSPSSSGDGNGRPGNVQQSSGSDGSSPMRRLPAVLHAPTGSNSAAANASSAPSTTTATRSQTQAQVAAQQHSRSPSAASTAAAGNRDITGMGRRHMYPSQVLASPYASGGASSPAQMQSQFFGANGGRITTGSSSYNHDHLSPMSSPAMGGSWTGAGSMATRGLKRHLPQQYAGYSRAGSSSGSIRVPQQQPAVQNAAGGAQSATRRGPSNSRSPTVQQAFGMPPNEDPMQYEPSGEARHPRDSTRYETWTSKQLRKKCSHLKLRGLKNVKKHVMVEALYRYYRNQRLKDKVDAASAEKIGAFSQQQISSSQQPQQRRMEVRRPSSNNGSSVSGGRHDVPYQSRYDQRSPGPAQSPYGPYNSRSRNYGDYGSQSPSPPSSGGDRTPHPQRGGPKSNSNGYYLDDESKGESQYKEVPVTSEDVIRLVDVVLSPEFVDRLAAELSRWQFWVDVREMYIALLSRQHPPGSATATEGGPIGTGGSATNSRNFKWSSMQLWEIWKELSFAYTKTCFEFTTAGMNKRVDDREYINFCDGRPDVYYLHQRLHLRPDLLHLIKSNEYIDEKCTSDASESIAHEQQQAQQQQQAGPLVGSGSPLLRAHKRYKRSSPAAAGSASSAYNSARAIAAFSGNTPGVDAPGATNGGNGGDNGCGQGSGDSRGHSPEENSTENSETTGEEGSSNTANSNASNSSQDVSMRAALAEQKYFGLLLQNFEVIFESLHNKKVLLATLRKDSKAPDHLIADLHDDIHVLSALKKEFRNKLRRTIQ